MEAKNFFSPVGDSSRKRRYSAAIEPESMTRDIRNITRGQCQACGDCEGFISVSGRVLCDYCGCPPAHHENLVKKARKLSDGGGDSAADRDLEENSQSDLSEVSSLEILELEDSNTEEDESAETAEEDSASSSALSSSTKKSSGYTHSFIHLVTYLFPISRNF